MQQAKTIKNRKEIIGKMLSVFDEDDEGLSAELQRILLDDMATAFQNRLNVLMRLEKTDNNQQLSKNRNTDPGSIKPLYIEH